jgi:lipoic acid synthetase
VQVLRKPDWLKIKIPSGEDYLRVKKTLRTYNLNTVCEESSCPNVSKCWESGTATIMIMGNMCTRVCRFCDVSSGRPAPLDPDEPKRVAEAIKQWNLRYIVITSVCRDDLEDGGAAHFAKTIKSVKLSCPNTIVEPLIPDFNYDSDSIKKIIESEPEVVSHNIETVRRLSSKVRDSRATYDQSLSVLKKIKEINPKIYTKSSFMVGHGETKEEVIQTASDLKSANVDVITAGQYLQPSLNHLPVVEYVHPEKFASYQKIFEEMGFLHVVVGPFVRSSFQAADFIEKIKSVKRYS